MIFLPKNYPTPKKTISLLLTTLVSGSSGRHLQLCQWTAFFAISLALNINGETQLGIVYDPVLDECFTAIKGQGAKLNDQSLRISNPPDNLQQCIAIIDHKRLDTTLSMRLIIDSSFHSQRSFGAAALEWCWLAAGRYVRSIYMANTCYGTTQPVLIVQEAGCVACTLENEPVFELSMCSRNIVAAVDNTLFEQWKTFILKLN